MRILVTGSEGFLGSHVVKQARTNKKLEVIRDRDEGAKRRFDLRYPEQVHWLCMYAKPEVVIHCAGNVGGIGRNQAAPADLWRDNLLMGMTLLHWASDHRPLRLVMVGTTCSYPAETPVPFEEQRLFDGFPEPTNAPYGIAKRALIIGGLAYRQQYGLNVVSIIPANLYGPGDSFDPKKSHAIPAMIRKIQLAKERQQDEVVLWGTGRPTRDFLHVRDAARGIVMAALGFDSPDPMNLGSGEERSIASVAEMIAKHLGYEGKIMWSADRPDGQARRCLDISRAKRFGWRPEVPFTEGLAETIDWWLEGRRK